MAVLKCKMCGGTIEFQKGATIGTCEYCGTKQTLPRLNDEKKAQLYDRANQLRIENEYDKAMGVYEIILSEDKEDAEAYWGIVLCKYGIYYVDDPRTHKRTPTINRSQYTRIYDDPDYRKAINFADDNQKSLYFEEAKIIDRIHKGILDISSKETPFDVFICYKEVDNFGNRTHDSVYAQEIYNALTKEGYKVFFSRITLEDKLGTAYEPYIFAALHSAKVMIAVGTSKENFNAVWVKNEWSRFIALAKKDSEKTIIPCYKDISAYDLPKEFAFLQAQDLSKIGYVQDIVHGVNKIIRGRKEENVSPKIEDAPVNNAPKPTELIVYETSPLKKIVIAIIVLAVVAAAGFFVYRNYFDKNTDTQIESVVAAANSSYAIDVDGKVIVYGEDKNNNDIASWKNIASISASQSHTVGLKTDKTVVATGEGSFGECDVTSWSDIECIDTGLFYTIGLKSDGTCVATGKNDLGQINVASWSNVEEISAGANHTVAVKKDGTVVATGYNGHGECDVSSWRDISSISAGQTHTVALKKDGTVVAVGDNGFGQCNVGDWKDIIMISAGDGYTIGLKKDGTCVSTGKNNVGQCDVSDWTDIEKIYAGNSHTVGVKSKGVVVTGNNSYGECEIKNIKVK